MKTNLLLLICLLFTSQNNYANDIITAIENYESGDFQAAYSIFINLAKNDDPEAQYNIAFMYFGGEGVQQDDTKAALWFEKAAKQGHAAAQDTLAYQYLNGRGVGIDRVKAYAWYSVAARNGIFLAENISKNLINQMDSNEQITANRLSIEYINKYK